MNKFLSFLVAGFLVFGVTVTPAGAMTAGIEDIVLGRNATRNSEWGEKIVAQKDDVVAIKMNLINRRDARTFLNVLLQIDIGGLDRSTLFVNFYRFGTNLVVPNKKVFVDTGTTTGYLVYVPGSAAIRVAGATHANSAIISNSGLTGKKYELGNIALAKDAMWEVVFDVKVSDVPAPTVAASPTPATSAAVAKTTPTTGLGDAIWLNTVGWLMVGATGLGLKLLAKNVKQKAHKIR